MSDLLSLTKNAKMLFRAFDYWVYFHKNMEMERN